MMEQLLQRKIPAPAPEIDLARGLFEQTRPFLKIPLSLEEPPTLLTPPDFDREWEAVIDYTGLYVDDLGQRISVRKRHDDGTLSEVNNIHWAAHNLARFIFLWAEMLLKMDTSNTSPLFLSRTILGITQWAWREDVRELAAPEMAQMTARADRGIAIPTPNLFVYPALLRELSAIRLVVLLPSAERHGDIECRLCNSTLGRSETDKYEALSYVWGDQSRRRTISVDNKPFQATENLESALRHLRFPDTHRVLWIDSICINQGDVAERNTQVQQMDSIYRNAQQVVVWLGPESEDSEDALTFLSCLPIFASDTVDHDRYMAVKPVFISYINAFFRLLNRTWFKRVWCVQELILARYATVQCGEHRVAWENFEAALKTAFFVPSPGSCMARVLEEGTISSVEALQMIQHLNKFTRWKSGMFQSDRSVLSMLAEFCDWQSSDPRDKVFAFYGLTSHENPDRDALKPDYALNTAEVYTKLALSIIRNHRNLDILPIATRSVSSLGASSLRLLPSWVPDWRDGQVFSVGPFYRPITFMGFGSLIYAFDDIYNASLNLEATPIGLQSDSQALILDGINLDTIDVINNDWPICSPPSLESLILIWKEIAGLPAENSYEYTGQPLHEAFWRTVLIDIHDIVLSTEIEGTQGQETPKRCRIPRWDIELDGHPYFPISSDDEPGFMKRAVRNFGAVLGRQFFKTAKGLFGLAPAHARRGDYVVVLFGGRVPFIMRNFPEIHLYHLVGERYATIIQPVPRRSGSQFFFSAMSMGLWMAR